MRINFEEMIPLSPPDFNTAQQFSNDELIGVLLFGTPNSWQKEMECQNFDPVVRSIGEVISFFMEGVSLSTKLHLNTLIIRSMCETEHVRQREH